MESIYIFHKIHHIMNQTFTYLRPKVSFLKDRIDVIDKEILKVCPEDNLMFKEATTFTKVMTDIIHFSSIGRRDIVKELSPAFYELNDRMMVKDDLLTLLNRVKKYRGSSDPVIQELYTMFKLNVSLMLCYQINEVWSAVPQFRIVVCASFKSLLHYTGSCL